MRTSKAELLFFINGRCLGVAATDLPATVFAVIDLYGQCVQVTIKYNTSTIMTSLDQTETSPNNDVASSVMDSELLDGRDAEPCEDYVQADEVGACALVEIDRLYFHPRCGALVIMSDNYRSAERAQPLDDFNNAVVMTHRPLKDNELFEIRIDSLVLKWSGSLEMGVTTHDPATLSFPPTMTNLDSGTIMMSGCKVFVNGHGTSLEYGNFNLDDLSEGDTVGVMRKKNGNLHYFINGFDQGVAAEQVDRKIWGVVDIYGITVKVSIVGPCDDINIAPLHHTIIDIPEVPARHSAALSSLTPNIDEDSLLFHTVRDSYAVITNDGKTANRPNAHTSYDKALVMTNRTLRTDELFQVRIELVIPKWAGSTEIGVTQNSSKEIQIRDLFKLSLIERKTWVLTDGNVKQNGDMLIQKYMKSVNTLSEGDTIGVMRKAMGILHFFVNGVDQGPAAFNVPENVFGVLDLYGRVAKVTIVPSYYMPLPITSPETSTLTESSTNTPTMCFHRVHGPNAVVSRTRMSARRSTPSQRFNDAVLLSSEPLRECDMFEVRIDAILDCWIGSLDIGVTAIRPEDMDAEGVEVAATDLECDTYMLSGSTLMKDGVPERSGYPLDLEQLTVGSRVGIMWHADKSIHFYLDGMDMGVAWYVPHLNIYAVIDLYAQCTQVTILRNDERTFNYNGYPQADNPIPGQTRTVTPPLPYWSFSEYSGENIELKLDYSVAVRKTQDPTNGLVFSSGHLTVGETYEVKIDHCKHSYSGGIRIGVTDINILNAHVNRSLPPSIVHLPHFTTYIDGRYMKTTNACSREHELRAVTPSFEWLRPGDRVGLKKTADGQVLVYYNSELLDTAFEKVPDKVYVVIELYGCVSKIQAVKREITVVPQTIRNSSLTPPATDAEEHERSEETSVSTSSVHHTERRRRSLPLTFHGVHGTNIRLCSSDTVAIRTAGYNDAIAIVNQPLARGHSCRFRIDRVDEEWMGSLAIGALVSLPKEELPKSALQLEVESWVLSNQLLYDGSYIRAPMVLDLEEVREQSVITLHFRFSNDLVVELNGTVLATLATVPLHLNHVYPVVDLYGRVCQISILLHPYSIITGISLDLPAIAESRTGESLAELDEQKSKTPELRHAKRSLSQECLIESYITCDPGPSRASPYKTKKAVSAPPMAMMHQSLIVTPTCQNREMEYRCVKKSHTAHDFSINDSNSNADYDTNIEQNDRYPEAHDVDLDNEIIDGLTLESGNLPDLTEEQSSSIDESIRRDDADALTAENLTYLKRLLSLEYGEASLESEWEASGEGCEHLHLVLKYWNYLVGPYPELRRAVSWGQVVCHCPKCAPDSESIYAGWVRFERIDGVGAARRGFWQVSRVVLMAAKTSTASRPVRPANLASVPSAANPAGWMDEEGKPHHTELALEIDIEGNDADKDRLLALLIYLKPFMVLADEELYSSDE
ncbi:neuralized-like protein 4 isoform X2 [Leptidea sinapis]|nr:neuralized-like protein 4 isoform X2 [Leptidea sinapis]